VGILGLLRLQAGVEHPGRGDVIMKEFVEELGHLLVDEACTVFLSLEGLWKEGERH
jgi:hypothetical protein